MCLLLGYSNMPTDFFWNLVLFQDFNSLISSSISFHLIMVIPSIFPPCSLVQLIKFIFINNLNFHILIKVSHTFHWLLIPAFQAALFI